MERTSIPAGQRQAVLAGAKMNIFEPGAGGRMPTAARLYACDMDIASLDHVVNRWREATDTDVIMSGVINDPNAPKEDQGKPCEIELGGLGNYDLEKGPKELRGTPRVQEYLQLSVILGIRTEEQAKQLIDSGAGIDISQEIAEYKARMGAQKAVNFPVYHRFQVVPFKDENKNPIDVGVAGRWSRVTTMEVYQKQIAEGKHGGTTREEFEAKNAEKIAKMKMELNLTDGGQGAQASPANGYGGTAPAGYGAAPQGYAPPIVPPPGGGMAPPPGPSGPATTAQAFGVPGMPPTS